MSFCPRDFAPIPMLAGIGVCPKCDTVYVTALTELRVNCDHEPRPVRGRYSFRGREVDYAYCSAECKAEAEEHYGGVMRDMGLL